MNLTTANMHFSYGHDTSCGLSRFEVEQRREMATCVARRVQCDTCKSWLARRAWRKATNTFFAPDLEHDLGDGGLGSGAWIERERERVEKARGYV